MTNPELIARMRSVLTFKDLRLCPTAADRIETLEAKLASSEATLLENEVRLRKAVEALRQIADPISLAQGNVNAEIAHATLEEISSPTKGADHD